MRMVLAVDALLLLLLLLLLLFMAIMMKSMVVITMMMAGAAHQILYMYGVQRGHLIAGVCGWVAGVGGATASKSVLILSYLILSYLILSYFILSYYLLACERVAPALLRLTSAQ